MDENKTQFVCNHFDGNNHGDCPCTCHAYLLTLNRFIGEQEQRTDLYSADRMSVKITALAQSARDMEERYREARTALYAGQLDAVSAAGIFDAHLGILFDMWSRLDQDNNHDDVTEVRAFPDAPIFE